MGRGVQPVWSSAAQPEQYFAFPGMSSQSSLGGFVPGPSAIVDAGDIVARVKVMWQQYSEEKKRLNLIDKWYKGNQPSQRLLRETPEARALLELSKTPWLGLVVSTVAQALFVDGFKDPDTNRNLSSWDTWVSNDMPTRQMAINRAALAYGYSYVIVLPGVRQDGTVQAAMKGISPKRSWAVYEDPANDEWPLYAMHVKPVSSSEFLIDLYDDTFVHTVRHDCSAGANAEEWSYIETVEHGAGCVPWVRYTNMLDLEGNTPGEVEPFIPIAQRIDKTMFDRLGVQHYNSWKKYIITGLAAPSKASLQNRQTTVDQAREIAKNAAMQVKMKDILTAPEGTDIKTLEETSMAGFLEAIRHDVDELASVSQIPSYLLNGGNLVNVNPDTLEAQRWGLTQKIAERQQSFGQSHAKALRLASKYVGDEEAATDFNARVTWQDFSVRSLAQAADALGKFAQMLGVPKQALWERIPNVTEADIQEWKEILVADDAVSRAVNGFADVMQPQVGGKSIRDANANGDVNAAAA